MKGIFSAIIISLLFLSVNAQKKLTDREFDGFKGKVKSVATSYSSFENKDGKSVEKPSGVKYEEHYDENGNTSMTLNYVVGDKNIYSFIDGEKTFKTVKNEGVGGSGISGTSSLDSKPKPRDERYSIKFKYKYDDKNQVTEEILYSNDGELISRAVYKYDEKGRVKETEKYNTYNSDKVTSRTTLNYDNENNLSERLFILLINNGSQTLGVYSNYKFDAQGNWTERTITENYRGNSKNSISKTIEHRTITYYEK
jgi:hypothetical protein